MEATSKYLPLDVPGSLISHLLKTNIDDRSNEYIYNQFCDVTALFDIKISWNLGVLFVFFLQVKWTPDKLQNEPFLFADFLDVHDDAKTMRVYRQLTDYPRLMQNLEEYYLRQNVSNSQAPQLVFFKYAVEHILRAARVFRQPGGHMLMVSTTNVNVSVFKPVWLYNIYGT